MAFRMILNPTASRSTISDISDISDLQLHPLKISRKILRLARRNKSSHKGDNGRVLIVAGSEFPGAGALCSMAALASLRSGSDLVTVAAPEKVAWIINGISPDIITVKLKGTRLSKSHIVQLKLLALKSSSVLIGPGLGQAAAKKFMALANFCWQKNIPIVLDAESIRQARVFSSNKPNKKSHNKLIENSKLIARNCIITPHQNELAGFVAKNPELDELDESLKLKIKSAELTATLTVPKSVPQSLAQAKLLAKNLHKSLSKFLKNNNVVLLKGRYDIILSEKNIFINTTGNEGMTVGGTGDVLAGIVAGLLSQKNYAFTSSAVAAYANGAAGDILYNEMGIGFLASDLIPLIPVVLKRFRK